MTIPSGAITVAGLETAMNSDDLESTSNIYALVGYLTWVNNYLCWRCVVLGGGGMQACFFGWKNSSNRNESKFSKLKKT